MSTIARCDLCDQFLVAESDFPNGYGKLSFVHPKPCVAKRGRLAFARKRARLVQTKECAECGRPFFPSRPQASVCTDSCRHARKNRALREKRAAA